MRLKRGQLIALVKIISFPQGRPAATIELIGTYKDPKAFTSSLREVIKDEIGSDNDAWQALKRPYIHAEYAEDEQQSFDLTVGSKKVPPIISVFEGNTVGDLDFFLSSHETKTPIAEIEISFVMKNLKSGEIVKFVGKNFSDDHKYKGKIKKARINELADKGLAFYREFEDIF
jgi:hypothetical protein